MCYKHLLKISKLHVVVLVGMPFPAKSLQEKTMRKIFEPQITFGTVPMSNIKFDIFCRHEIVPVLMALQHLYFNKPVLNEILELIKKDIVGDKAVN
jgi:hypothetical protein